MNWLAHLHSGPELVASSLLLPSPNASSTILRTTGYQLLSLSKKKGFAQTKFFATYSGLSYFVVMVSKTFAFFMGA